MDWFFGAGRSAERSMLARQFCMLFYPTKIILLQVRRREQLTATTSSMLFLKKKGCMGTQFIFLFKKKKKKTSEMPTPKTPTQRNRPPPHMMSPKTPGPSTPKQVRSTPQSNSVRLPPTCAQPSIKQHARSSTIVFFFLLKICQHFH